jgi:hypothetical protein
LAALEALTLLTAMAPSGSAVQMTLCHNYRQPAWGVKQMSPRTTWGSLCALSHQNHKDALAIVNHQNLKHLKHHQRNYPRETEDLHPQVT